MKKHFILILILIIIILLFLGCTDAPVCGNGVCEFGETPENCPIETGGDCPELNMDDDTNNLLLPEEDNNGTLLPLNENDFEPDDETEVNEDDNESFLTAEYFPTNSGENKPYVILCKMKFPISYHYKQENTTSQLTTEYFIYENNSVIKWKSITKRHWNNSEYTHLKIHNKLEGTTENTTKYSDPSEAWKDATSITNLVDSDSQYFNVRNYVSRTLGPDTALFGENGEYAMPGNIITDQIIPEDVRENYLAMWGKGIVRQVNEKEFFENYVITDGSSPTTRCIEKKDGTERYCWNPSNCLTNMDYDKMGQDSTFNCFQCVSNDDFT
jgi:hypothetical protein